MIHRRTPATTAAASSSALVVGAAFIAFGLVSLFSHAGSTHPVNFAAFFIGLALVHDLIVAAARYSRP